MINAFDLTGKVALVTGGTYGIGMAMAKALGKAGATIIINARRSEMVDEAVAEYKKEGLKAYGFTCDVTQETQVQEMVAAVEKEVGSIDILVNNADVTRTSHPNYAYRCVGRWCYNSHTIGLLL